MPCVFGSRGALCGPVQVVAALAMTGTCSMAHRAPIPLAAPNYTHGGIEGGYGTHDNSARDGVRGFEGSGVRGFGVRFPRASSDLKKSNPSAGWQCQNGPRRGQFWSQMSTWTLGNRVRATCASSELCGLTSLTRTMQKNRVLSPKNAPKNSRSHLSNDLSFWNDVQDDGIRTGAVMPLPMSARVTAGWQGQVNCSRT